MMNIDDVAELSIVSAKHIESYILELRFNNKHIQRVDLSSFIFSNRHPDYEQYKNKDMFLNYKLIDGNLNWDDYRMIFTVEDLYKGKI